MLDLIASWAQAGAWGYLAVALAAAVPWLEVLLVIPPAVAFGLDPVLVAVAAFAGNYLPVVGIVLGYQRLSWWLARRRGERDTGGGRGQRGRRLLARYGVPGLALLGPLITGAHLAAVLAAGTGASPYRVLLWTGAGLAAWTVGVTVASMLGVAAVTG